VVGWEAYGGDPGSARWSPLTDLTPGNVAGLAPAWRWETGEERHTARLTGETVVPGKFEATPVTLGDTLVLSTPFNRVVALDGATGRELWSFDPGATDHGLIADDRSGFVHRGVAAWSDGEERRIFHASRWQLHALDARDGTPVEEFGEGGAVDLSRGLRWEVNRLHVGRTSPPVVWGDVVVVGSVVGDRIIYERDPPGDVLAFDARTGERLWRWDPVPAEGTPERATWGGRSAEVTGHVNVWAPMSVDAERGLLFLPVSAPSNDWYGGLRPGDNLFAQSLVALDIRTGERVWHRQLVRHDLWDYDLAAAPALVDVARPGGDTVPAVLQATKMGYLYGFDRRTGEPLWPVEDRPAPASDVPGEEAAATQPHAVWPPPFARQGFGPDDVIDLTPELRERALALLDSLRTGPMFTPPSLEGTVVMPGWIGGAGWGALSVDPERGLAFVKATNEPVLARLIPSGDALRFRLDTLHSSPKTPLMLELPRPRRWFFFEDGPVVRVPVVKPPWGTLTAYDLTSGEIVWHVPIGDTPAVREHPSLRDVELPPLGVAGAPGGVATASGLIFLTGGGEELLAVDSETGAVLWSAPLGQPGPSNPMTFRARDGRQYVVVATGLREGASLQAFALPREGGAPAARPGAPGSAGGAGTSTGGS
jgi:quinoprotein glucose dehydrogenase